MHRALTLTLFAVFAFMLPALAGAPAAPISGFLSVKDGHFIDAEGRHVILHGINIVKKHAPYISYHQPEDYANMRAWGFNCVRMVTVWAAVEPECGQYDEEYLEKLDQRIAWAKANGLYVLLDMHQDLWGEKPGGDGAPAWATLDGGQPHNKVSGGLWSDAYFTSPMIHAAFDSFWANKPGPDGVGIQERFALAWQHLAKRYAGESAVVGYDILNEPFIGSGVLAAPMYVGPTLFKFLETQYPEGEAPGLLELGKMMGDEKQRIELLRKFNDIEIYTSLADAAAPAFQAFEKDRLQPMYQRVADAIREVDPKHIIFTEPSPTSNVGVRSALGPVNGPDGKPCPLQAIAPHAYDIFLDTSAADEASPERLELVFSRHAEHAAKLNMPFLVGEWGAFYGSDKVLPAARIFVRQLESTLANDTYWSSHKGIEDAVFFESLQRPYPATVAGTLLSYRTQPEERILECSWEEKDGIGAPTCIYIPALWFPGGYEVDLEPQGTAHTFEALGEDPHTGYLVIPPASQAGQRRLTVRPKKDA